MGADPHFYRDLPQPCEVPYTPTSVPRSRRRNQQRQRESQATIPADEVLGLLRTPPTAAAGCKALARCGDMDGLARCGDVDGDHDLLEALVETMHARGPVDAAVARHGCTALVSLCRGSAEKQAQVAAFGAFAAAAACARAYPQHLPQACAAVVAQQGQNAPVGGARVGLLRLLGARARLAALTGATRKWKRASMRLNTGLGTRASRLLRPCRKLSARARARRRGASLRSRRAG